MKLEDMLSNSELSKTIFRKVLLVITFTIVLIFAIFHLDQVINLLKAGLSIISPFLIGIVIAFVLNILIKNLENKVFASLNKKNYKLWNKCRRGVCILIAFILVMVFATAIIFFVLPEFARSLKILVDNAPQYIEKFTIMVDDFMKNFNVTQEKIGLLGIDWSSILSKVTNITTDFVGSLFDITMGVTSGLISFLMSIIFAIYMLFSKEKLLKNLRKFLYAFLPARIAKRTIEIGGLANSIFARFVSGQFTEALIIGVLCYLGMSILGLPYALLVSTIVCITSIIPIFGAYIGGFLGGFILLIINPVSCLIFVIFIVLLQQFEGNLIYPRVVGTSIGLPGMWVMLAIFVFGDLFGIGGILLGVPTASLIYFLLREAVGNRLKKKEISEKQIMDNEITVKSE